MLLKELIVIPYETNNPAPNMFKSLICFSSVAKKDISTAMLAMTWGF